jgi:PKD repeat protein
MSAPQVTGTAAIVASMTTLRGAELRARILGTTDDLGSAGYDTRFGSGRLNSYRAVTGVTLNEGGGPPPPPPPPPLQASFVYSCSQATCSFNGSGSTGATSYSWNFGDGGSASGAIASHTFAEGDWTVTLTVDDGTSTDAASRVVACDTRGKKLMCR